MGRARAGTLRRVLYMSVVGAGLLAVCEGSVPRALGRMWRGECPFAVGQPSTAAQLDAAYGRQLALARGAQAARGQYALGLILKQTSVASFTGWAESRGARCRARPDKLGLHCDLDRFERLEQSFYPHGPGVLLARFDRQGRLQSIAAQQHLQAPQAAIEAVGRALGHLEKLAGAPERRRGELSAAYLGRGALMQVGGDFRFTDYLAEVSVTHMGRLGYITFQQTYTSLLDG